MMIENFSGSEMKASLSSEAINKKSSKKDKPESIFEKNERPKYRYFYHGTFMPLVDKIERDGFKFREYFPNLTLSPAYAYRFLEDEIKGGADKLAYRGKHLSPEELAKFRPEKIKHEDSVLLVIEPDAKYTAHSTNEGKPNFFSTSDQIPDDIDKTIRTRIWHENQYAMSGEPIARKNKGEHKYPGIHINTRMLPDGKWVRLEEEKQITASATLPESSVKMVIKKESEFLKIFQDMEKGIKNGERINLATYKQRLVDYFKNGQGIIKREMLDEDELAENMVMGELEYSIVTRVRRLYLDLERYKGKKFIEWETNKEKNRPIKTREQLLNQISKLRSIQPDNEVFRRYIDICTNAIEKELNEATIITE
jgi:hypothetical protein